jgi:hypothetical protein
VTDTGDDPPPRLGHGYWPEEWDSPEEWGEAAKAWLAAAPGRRLPYAATGEHVDQWVAALRDRRLPWPACPVTPRPWPLTVSGRFWSAGRGWSAAVSSCGRRRRRGPGT